MGQVPRKHSSLLIIGSGRLATHLQHYLQLLGTPAVTWSRDEPIARLFELTATASRVALVISDAAIVPFFEQHRELFADKIVFHCSGALSTPQMPSAHPLMTFTPTLYDLGTYQQILFVTEKTRLSLSELMPELTNANVSIPKEHKALYHALCVAGGNFTTLLWTEVLQQLTSLGLPRAGVEIYLQQIAQNVLHDPARALTGPLVRGDLLTIEKNLTSLEGSRLHGIYSAFLNWFPQLRPLSKGVRDERPRFSSL